MSKRNPTRRTAARSAFLRGLWETLRAKGTGETRDLANARRRLGFESLETRQLLATISAGAAANNGITDSFYLVQSGVPGNIDVYVNNAFTGTLVAPSDIQVFGSNDDDVLTVDSTNGLIDLPGGIRFFGGAGQDGLVLSQTAGATRDSERLEPGSNPGQGTSLISSGALDQIVYFEGLEPIQSNVPAATFTIAAFPAAASLLQGNNAINYSSHPLNNTFGRVTIDSYEPIDFQNKTTVVIDAGSGDDTINLNNPNTPTGLTGINVGGGDPTASDTLVINGTAGNDAVVYSPSNTLGAGNVTVNAAPAVNFSAIEHVTLNGQGGTDALTHATPAGVHQVTYTPGSASDAGTIGTREAGLGAALVPLTFSQLGAGGSVSFTSGGGREDVLELNGTANSDIFAVNQLADRIQITNLASSFVTVALSTAGVDLLSIRSLEGDDRFNVLGNLPYSQFIVEAGGPSAGDTLNFSGAGGLITVDLAAETIAEAGFNAVSYSGVEHININAAGAGLNVNGTAANDRFDFTPTAAGVGSFVVNTTGAVVRTSPQFTYSGVNNAALNVDGLAGTNTLSLIGTAAADTIVGTAAAVTQNGGTVTIAANIGRLEIAAGLGNDTLTVDSTNGAVAIPINFDGGDNNDSLTLIGGTATTSSYEVGPNITEGTSTIVIGAVTQVVRFNALEPVFDFVAGPLVVTATDGDNAINYTQGGVAANGLVSIDGFETIEFSNKTTLTINALAGSDTINLRNPTAPTGLTGITVNGGDPITGDKLVIAGTAAATDNVTFTPTSATAGTLTGLAVPVAFSTVTQVVYDGNDNTGSDAVTINGTIASDTYDFDAGNLRGQFRSGLSPDFDTQLAARITVNGGPAGHDQVNVVGSDGTDFVTSVANVVAINTPGSGTTITLGAGIDALTVSTLAGNDAINLSGVAAPITTTVYGGTGDDAILGSPQADLLYGGDGNDVIIGGAGVDVAYGEDGNDRFGDPAVADPAANDAGNDQFFGGAGSDTLVWDAGDGSDQFEGGTGEDVMVFNGGAASEIFTFTANGTRLTFTRNVGGITMDTAEVEQVTLNAAGGLDVVTVNDLFGTAVRAINVNLGTDGATDFVTVNGRTIADNLAVSTPGVGAISLAGLSYNIGLTGAEAADGLTVNGSDGNDQITVSAGAETVLSMTLSGGRGDDVLSGNVTTILGNEGDDTLIGGAGNQNLDGGEGDDTFVGGGGTDNVGGGAGASAGDTLVVAGTTGFDTISLALSATGQLLATVNGVTTTYGNFIGGAFATSGIEQILVQGLAGNDTLTVDSTNGAIPVLINFDGGNNNDSLTLTGGTATTSSYEVGPNITEGTSTIVIGGVTQVVRFNALEPVFDFVAGPLVVSATDGDNAINYTQGAAPANGRVTIDGFESIEFSNKDFVTIQAGAGADTIQLASIAPTGLVNVFVDGGDPLDADTVTIAGDFNLNTFTVTSVGAQFANVQVDAFPLIFLNAVEKLTLDGAGGDDAIVFQTLGGPDEITLTPGATFDSGTITVANALAFFNNSIPLTFQNLGAAGFSSVTFADVAAGSEDTLVINGTQHGDNFAVDGATGRINLNQQIPVFATGANVGTLVLQGFAGDDDFDLTGTLPYTAVTIDGGEPSASDTVSLTAAVGPVTIDLAAETVVGFGGTVTIFGVETLNATAAANAVTILGRNAGAGSAETITVTPTGANTATTTASGLNLTVNTDNTAALTINPQGGSDVLRVNGTQAAETLTVNSTSVVATTTGFKTVTYTGAATEALQIYGLGGADIIDVTPSTTTQIFVDGGDPIGTTGDRIVLHPAGAFVLQPGPEKDEGGLLTAAQRVSWDHIEEVTIIGGGPALVLGTNGDDDITVIARDASTHAGTDGVRDFTVTVNDFFEVLFIDQANLAIDALAGDDDIVVRAPAPNNADWNVQIIVGGGPAASPTTDQGDTLEFETPGAFDQVIYTAAGPEMGTFTLDQGADSIIVMVSSFTFDPGGVNYIFSPGGIENVVYDGVNAAGFDVLTINGSTLTDTVTYEGGQLFGDGSFRSFLSPKFDFAGVGRLTFNGGGGSDIANFNGSAVNDTVTSTATTVTISSTAGTAILTIGTSVERLVLNTGDGADNIDLDLQVAALEKFVYAGGGNDTVNLAGLLVDAADPTIYGGDGDDILVGSPNSDEIFGGEGNDTITAGAGADFIYGQDGSDTILWNNGDGSDQIEGGTGNDTVTVLGAGAAFASEQYLIQANGTRVQLSRLNLTAFTLNIAQTERLSLDIDDSTDNAEVVTVNSLLGTELQLLEIDAGNVDLTNTLILNGSPAADQISVGARPTAPNSERVLGLGPIIDLLTFDGSGAFQDRLTINGLEGDDDIRVNFGVLTSPPLFTLNGGSGNDRLSTAGATLASILSGGAGNDILTGGNAADTLNGDAGEDVIYVDLDGANDLITGGADYDTIVLQGTSAGDVLSAFQSAAGTLATTRNGTVDSDTIATIERVQILAGAGDDTIFVQHLDALKNDAAVNNAVLFDIDGGTAFVADRLVVQDNGASDVMIYRKSGDPSNGSVTVAPVTGAITESLNTVFSGIEYVDPRTTNANNIFVFKYDPYEWNGNFQNATHLGAGTLNVDPVIDPGVPVIALPPGFPALPGADEDFYRIEAEVTGTLDVQAFFRHNAALPGAGNLDIQLLDATGAVIASDTDADDDARVRIAAVEGQVYYLRVFSGAANAINVYSLTVINEAAPVPFGVELVDTLVILGGDPNHTGTADFTYNAAANTFDLDLFVAGVELVNTSGQPQLGQVSIQTAGGAVIVNIPTAAAIQEPNGVRLTLNNVAFSAVAANITSLQNGQLFIDVDYTAPVGSIRGQITSDAVLGVSDSGRSQFDNVTFDDTPTFFIRVADGKLLNDVPDNGNGPGLPVDGDIISIPHNTSTATNAAGSGFRVALFVSEADTNGGIFVGYAQPVPSTEGLYQATIPLPFLVRDGSWFVTSRIEMVDPASAAVEAQGFGAQSEPFEFVLDRTAPPAVFGLTNNDVDGLHPDSDTGIAGFPGSFTDRITSDQTPTFWGTAESDAIVRVFVDSTLNGTIGVYDPGIDPQIGMVVAHAADGTNASPNGNWQITSQINFNDPLYFAALDGLRTVFMTAEDLAGNENPDGVQILQTLALQLDTQGPQITDVDINTVGNPYDLFAPKPVINGPTPVTNALVISFQDLPAQFFPFNNGLAFDPVTGLNPDHYELVGDYVGNIPIATITVDFANPVPQVPGPVQGVPANPAIPTAAVTLTFFSPLPDDRYTLRVKDTILDTAGNKLDGDTNGDEPLPGSPILGIDGDTDPFAIPSGDGVPGTTFQVRFTIDTRPEVGTWQAGSAWVDLNGNTSFDPTNGDFVNRDVIYQFGSSNDNLFAGEFTTQFGVTDGWDKIAAYGLINGQYRFLIDTDNDGVPNIVASSAANPNGLPVAGNFDGNAANGDEVAVFTGTAWSFDLNRDYIVGDAVVPTAMRGTPFVGDFDGDGVEDLGVYQNDTFSFDLSTAGGAFTGNIDVQFNWGLIGSRERPVVADMNMDGFDDIGLWNPDRAGVASSEGAEWYWLVSGLVNNNDGFGQIGAPIVSGVGGLGAGGALVNGGNAFDRVVFDPATGRNIVRYTPTPFGNDLYLQYGDEFAMPIVGNFDPPPVNPVTQTNARDQFDVDANGTVDAQDILYVVNAYTAVSRGVSYEQATAGIYADVDHDGMITPQDILYTIKAFEDAAKASGASGESTASAHEETVDSLFGDTGSIDDLLGPL